MKQRLVIIATLVAALAAGATACAPQPTESGGPTVPPVGCYKNVLQSTSDVQVYAVTAKNNLLAHATENGTCADAGYGRFTLVPASNLTEADARCIALTGYPSDTTVGDMGAFGYAGLEGWWFCIDQDPVNAPL